MDNGFGACQCGAMTCSYNTPMCNSSDPHTDVANAVCEACTDDFCAATPATPRCAPENEIYAGMCLCGASDFNCGHVDAFAPEPSTNYCTTNDDTGTCQCGDATPAAICDSNSTLSWCLDSNGNFTPGDAASTCQVEVYISNLLFVCVKCSISKFKMYRNKKIIFL